MKTKLKVIYVLVAILTFGHAWHRDYSATLDQSGTAYLAAPVFAALWPLYWSTVAWQSHFPNNSNNPKNQHAN